MPAAADMGAPEKLLDLVTVLLLHKTSLLVGAATLFLVWLRSEYPKGVIVIAVAFLMLAIGSFLAGLGESGAISTAVWRDTSPGAGTGAYTMLFLGMRRLDRRVGHWRWLLLIPLAILVIGLATPVFADNTIRATTFHVGATAALLAAGGSLIAARHGEPLPSRLTLAATLLLCGAIYGFQTVLLVLGLATPATLALGFSATLMLNFAIAALVISLVRERQEEHHRRISVTDALTGVPNRHGFMSLVPETLGADAAIALLDLDHFKKINDRLGHAAGDHVLVSFTQLAQRHLCKDEVLARIGGEEFVLYLPDGRNDRARYLIEEIRTAVRASGISWEGQRVAVTASFGLVLPDSIGQRDRQKLIARADAAVYRAKAEGRDRVVIAPEEPSAFPGASHGFGRPALA